MQSWRDYLVGLVLSFVGLRDFAEIGGLTSVGCGPDCGPENRCWPLTKRA